MSLEKLRREFASSDMAELKARITWNLLVEPGDRIAGALIAEFGAVGALEKFLTRNSNEIEAVDSKSIAEAFERWTPRYSVDLTESKISEAGHHDLKVVIPSDELWPERLNDLGAHRPVLLWYRGCVERFQDLSRAVGVIGSRNATAYGQRVTYDVAETLAREHAAVVSGGALGVDAIAHRATIQCGGVTVGFMAGSLDNPYPSANLDLFEKISHGGLLLSEMTPGSRPTRWRFLQRNRLIAALSEALVVTEAGWRSGSINTVNHAGDLGRTVFAVPGPITNPASAGCNRLILDQKAQLLLDVQDLPQELGWRTYSSEGKQPLGQLELRVLDALGRRPLPVETVLRLVGITASELKMSLGELLLLNLVERTSTGEWRKLEI